MPLIVISRSDHFPSSRTNGRREFYDESQTQDDSRNLFANVVVLSSSAKGRRTPRSLQIHVLTYVDSSKL